MTKLCPECGANPCYRICPTQDPYQGDQQRENEDYEANARYDDVRERYAGEIDPEYEARCADMDDTYRANDDGTVTLITATGGEHTYDPADLADDEPTDAEVRRARQSNIDHGRTTSLHPLGDLPF